MRTWVFWLKWSIFYCLLILLWVALWDVPEEFPELGPLFFMCSAVIAFVMAVPYPKD